MKMSTIINKSTKSKNLSKRTKFILSFIASSIYSIGGISILVLGQCNVYIYSYLHYMNKNQDIDLQYGNLMIPLLMLFFYISIPLGGYIEKKIGSHFTLISSTLLGELMIIFFINQTNKNLTLILVILLGVFFGFGISIPIKNVLSYYPKKKSTISSLLGSNNTIIGAIVNFLSEKIINPEKVILKDGEKYFPLNICLNYIKFFKYLLFIIPITLLISLITIQKYDPKTDNEEMTTNIKNSEVLPYNNNNIENFTNEKKSDYWHDVKSILKTLRVWRIIYISAMTTFGVGFCTHTFRVYGAVTSINGTIMQYYPIFNALCSVIMGPIWGILNDKFKYKVVIKILTLTTIIQALILVIFISNNYLYVGASLLGAIITSGFNSVNFPHVIEVYTIKYSLEIGGLTGIVGGVFHIIKAVLAVMFSKYYTTGKELRFPYRIMYAVGLGLSCFSMYLTFFENDVKFVYRESNKEVKAIIENMKNDNNTDNSPENINNTESKFDDKKNE